MIRERPFADRRREAGLDLYRAAARLRINPQYLRSLELGRAPLSMGLGQRMAVEYGCSLRALTLIAPADRVPAGGTGEGREPSGNGSCPRLG